MQHFAVSGTLQNRKWHSNRCGSIWPPPYKIWLTVSLYVLVDFDRRGSLGPPNQPAFLLYDVIRSFDIYFKDGHFIRLKESTWNALCCQTLSGNVQKLYSQEAIYSYLFKSNILQYIHIYLSCLVLGNRVLGAINLCVRSMLRKFYISSVYCISSRTRNRRGMKGVDPHALLKIVFNLLKLSSITNVLLP